MKIQDFIFYDVFEEGQYLLNKCQPQVRKALIESWKPNLPSYDPYFGRPDTAENHASSEIYEFVYQMLEAGLHDYFYEFPNDLEVNFELTPEDIEHFTKMWHEKSGMIEDENHGEGDMDWMYYGCHETVEEFLDELVSDAYQFYNYGKLASQIKELSNDEFYRVVNEYLAKIGKSIDKPVEAVFTKYRNWPDDKKLPEYMEVVEGYVMPEDVEPFFPGHELLFGSWIFYTHDGLWWDLKNHCFTDN